VPVSFPSMAVQDQPALADRVYALLGGLGSTDAVGPIGPDTELKTIGFDSLAGAEFAAAAERELEVDLVDSKLADVRTAGELAALVERTAARERRGREAYPTGMGQLQPFAMGVLRPFCRWWFSLDVRGTQYMPRTGPVVLCMNHESLLDIPLVGVASARPVRMMAKQELFAKPAGARFFHELGGFPVERGAFDLRAVEIALEVLRRGEVLGMYPEGTRTPGTLLPFLPGAAWLALSTGAPLLPCAITGTHEAMPKGSKFFKRVPIRIEFGPTISVEREADHTRRRQRAVQLTEAVRGEIESMWNGGRAAR
jgi:1-acyl-sn-glycerol-3-phosphate acyltransferase